MSQLAAVHDPCPLQGDEDLVFLLYNGFSTLDLIGPHHFMAHLDGARIPPTLHG